VREGEKEKSDSIRDTDGGEKKAHINTTSASASVFINIIDRNSSSSKKKKLCKGSENIVRGAHAASEASLLDREKIICSTYLR
jgi:hypothetical protein